MFRIGFERLRLVVIPNLDMKLESLAAKRDYLCQRLSRGFGPCWVSEVERMDHNHILPRGKDIVLRSLLRCKNDSDCVVVIRGSIACEAYIDLMPHPVRFNISRNTKKTVVVLGEVFEHTRVSDSLVDVAYVTTATVP